MVLKLDPNHLAALNDHHTSRYTAAAHYGTETTIPSVPLTVDGSISFDGDANIQSRATLYLADEGASLVPKSKDAPLATFGQEITIVHETTFAGQNWSIPMGRFRIAEVPSAKEYFLRYPSQLVTAGWAAQLELRDRFDQIAADDFLETTAPIAGKTTWEEIQRVSPIAMQRSLPDRAVPAGMVYESRLGAIGLLADNIGGSPHMTRQGALTVRKKDAWLTETALAFTINGVIDMDDGMSNNFYNQVVARSSTGDNQIVSIARITDRSNPLAVSRAGGRTYKWSSPLITSQQECDAAAATILARVSTRQSRTITVTCLPRPDLELGDFGLAKDTISGREVVGEISSMRFPADPTKEMTLTLILAETR